MATKKSLQHKKNEKTRTIGVIPYDMGHILYMAQLTGSIEKKGMLASTPKHEKVRYKKAFESLVEEGILIQVEKQGKKDDYFINPKHSENAKELIHRFVRGTKEERRGKEIQRNPFFHRGPIKDIEYFIGRHGLISHIFDRLRHTEDCSIIGPRAIGKTSMLHYISHEETVRKFHLDPNKYIFVYYDLERFGEDVVVKDVYHEMFLRTVSQIDVTGIIAKDEIRKINKETGDVIKKINKSLFDMGDLEALIGALSERDYKVVYMFDEFDNIAGNPTFDYSFYGQLRAISGNPAFKVAFITASKQSIYDLTFVEEIKTSPFFRYFEDFRLGPMGREEARGFYNLAAENGVVFPNQVRTLIEEWSGGHPFLIQLTCDYFFDLAMNGNVLEPGDEERHLGTFLRQHKKHFAYFWKQVDEKQQECLWRLIYGKSIKSDCKAILENLEESYLVVRKNEEYQIFSRAFDKFVRDLPHPK